MQKEIYTRALVLARRESGEWDGMISLFTEDYGKVMARAKSIRKITSKLSSHLQPLHFVFIRLAHLPGPRDGFGVIDCVADEKFLGVDAHRRFDLLPVLSFLDRFLCELETDRRLWAFLTKFFSSKFSYHEAAGELLSILGFDSRHASCARCAKKEAVSFLFYDQEFLCAACSLKVPSNKLFRIKRNGI